MTVLVDYDNVPSAKRKAGIVHLVEEILRAAETRKVAIASQVTIRLYGGWYEENRPTRAAQLLVAEIAQSFPYYHRIVASGSQIPVMAELAYALLVDPARHLWHTYRRRKAPVDLRCDTQLLASCPEPDCPIRGLGELIANGVCGHPSCNRQLPDLIYRGQQKLVDGMLAADLVHVALVIQAPVCLVSSDDDFWPALHTVALSGRPVLHAQTQRPSGASQEYCRGIPTNYVPLPLYGSQP